MRLFSFLLLSIATLIYAQPTTDNVDDEIMGYSDDEIMGYSDDEMMDPVDKEVTKFFEELIRVGNKIKLFDEWALSQNNNYGFLVQDVFKLIDNQNLPPSLKGLSVGSLDNLTSLKTFISTVVAEKLVPAYSVKDDECCWSNLDLVYLSFASNGNITKIDIGAIIEATVEDTDDRYSFKAIRDFRRAVIFIKLLLGICGDQKLPKELNKLQMFFEPCATLKGDPYWRIFLNTSTPSESWGRLNNALRGLDFTLWSSEFNPSKGWHGSYYNILRLDQSTLWNKAEYFIALLNVSLDEESDEFSNEELDEFSNEELDQESNEKISLIHYFKLFTSSFKRPFLNWNFLPFRKT